jgi:hypothetical protein
MSTPATNTSCATLPPTWNIIDFPLLAWCHRLPLRGREVVASQRRIHLRGSFTVNARSRSCQLLLPMSVEEVAVGPQIRTVWGDGLLSRIDRLLWVCRFVGSSRSEREFVSASPCAVFPWVVVTDLRWYNNSLTYYRRIVRPNSQIGTTSAWSHRNSLANLLTCRRKFARPRTENPVSRNICRFNVL